MAPFLPVTLEDLAVLVAADVPAKRRLGLVRLATLRTEERFLRGVA